MSTSGWTTHYSLGCQPIDYSNDKMAVRMLEYVWWTLILKMVELIETVFFVLRKKHNQISKLHVYHHVSTFWWAWVLAKYIGGKRQNMHRIVFNSYHSNANRLLRFVCLLFFFFDSRRNGHVPHHHQLLHPRPNVYVLFVCLFWSKDAEEIGTMETEVDDVANGAFLVLNRF